MSSPEAESNDSEADDGEQTSFAQSKAKPQGEVTPKHDSTKSTGSVNTEPKKAFIQGEHGYIDVSDTDVQDALDEAHIGQEDNTDTASADDTEINEDSDSNGEQHEDQAPEETAQAEEGSDIALYGGQETTSVDTSGSEAGSDMALYANNANSDVDEGSDQSLYGGEGHEESSE